MMSLLALAGFGIFQTGGLDGADASLGSDENYDDDNLVWQGEGPGHEGGDMLAALDQPDPVGTLDFSRGDKIAGFDPATDILELEYTAAMGEPEISLIEFEDGSGMSVALNGVVVADVENAPDLDVSNVVLMPV